jgi:hypothetical protein
MPEQNIAATGYRTERWIVVAAVVVIVIWRSGVLVFWPEAQFDSDQAVMGLMAKHLVEGRAFPFFMYGQSYILGVQAWMAAPLFALFGVSVTALKLPLLGVNIAIAVLLVRWLEIEAGIRPALAALAAAPFILPAPGTTGDLLEASGGNPEPFLYVMLIWITRRRPWICGVVLGIGFLQREFTIYGLLALLCVEAINGSRFTRALATRTGVTLFTAGAIWLAAQEVRQFSSAAGPGTNVADLTVAPNNLVELANRTCIAPSTLGTGVRALLTTHWPQLLGTAPYRVAEFSIESRIRQGAAGASLLPAAACALALIGIAGGGRTANHRLTKSMCAYLLLAGLFSAGGYIAARCGELNLVTMRYDLLSLLAMVALGAWFLAVVRWTWMRNAWIAAVICWTLLAATAHVRLWHEYLNDPPVPDKHVVLQALRDQGVQYARADYWFAYYIAFLTKERIIVASTDFVRIRVYNNIVTRHAAEAVTISRTPCSGGRELVAGIFQCR